jgi:predicted O-methyltransferase YrrM
VPDYTFTNNWFASNMPAWRRLLSQTKPAKLLEVGSYEGASACFLIETCAAKGPIELHCIDTWEGGIEHKSGGTFEADMSAVESRFHQNTRLALENAPHPVDLVLHRGYSAPCLAALVTAGKSGYFDFCYVDGSHQASDVLADAVLSFMLLRVGGILVFDDYLWAERLPYGTDPLRCPKPAIDAFTNLYARKVGFIRGPVGQVYLQKTSD